jgi:hypothetical protein
MVSFVDPVTPFMGTPPVIPTFPRVRENPIKTDDGYCFVIPDPEAAFAPDYLKQTALSTREKLLTDLQESIESFFDQELLGWADFDEARVQLFRKREVWNEDFDASFDPETFQKGRWKILQRAVFLTYHDKRKPYRKAFMDKITRGESRLSKLPINEVFYARLTEDEARECGLLLPPHDEIRLLLKLRP